VFHRAGGIQSLILHFCSEQHKKNERAALGRAVSFHVASKNRLCMCVGGFTCADYSLLDFDSTRFEKPKHQYLE
jgi:hypothetical protein